MNSYLLTFDVSRASRNEFVECIDSMSEIANWMFFFDGSACIVSDLSAQKITNLIRERLPNAHFLLAELDKGKRGGWLRKSVWDFIKDPKPVSG